MEIIKLTLQTNNLRKVERFYTQNLDLKLMHSSPQFCSLVAGQSVLHFTRAVGNETPKYHFAFNIAPNLFTQAKIWLAENVALIRGKQGQDEFDFSSWNARGMYFYDPATNIGELIARSDLPPSRDTAFDPGCILSISEIGIPVEDVPATVALIQNTTGLQPYKGQTDTFTALGDENGLLIVVQTGREWYPNTGQTALASTLEVIFETGNTQYMLINGTTGTSITPLK